MFVLDFTCCFGFCHIQLFNYKIINKYEHSHIKAFSAGCSMVKFNNYRFTCTRLKILLMNEVRIVDDTGEIHRVKRGR